MGLFGKYAIRVTCVNGEVGFYMDLMDGYITLTRSSESAERFLTKNGACGFADAMDWDTPVFGDEEVTYVKHVDLVELR